MTTPQKEIWLTVPIVKHCFDNAILELADIRGSTPAGIDRRAVRENRVVFAKPLVTGATPEIVAATFKEDDGFEKAVVPDAEEPSRRHSLYACIQFFHRQHAKKFCEKHLLQSSEDAGNRETTTKTLPTPPKETRSQTMIPPPGNTKIKGLANYETYYRSIMLNYLDTAITLNNLYAIFGGLEGFTRSVIPNGPSKASRYGVHAYICFSSAQCAQTALKYFRSNRPAGWDSIVQADIAERKETVTHGDPKALAEREAHEKFAHEQEVRMAER